MVEAIKVDTTVDRIRSKSKEDRTFALKLDNHFCPMTPLFIGAFTIPRNLTKDTLEYYYKNSQFNIPDKMEIKVYLI